MDCFTKIALKEKLHVFVAKKSSLLASKRGQDIKVFHSLLTTTAKHSGSMDFLCNFGDDGVCSQRRETLSHYDIEKPEMCCCRTCYKNLGFLDSSKLLFAEDLAIYRKLFKHDIGFWRARTGCVLPRELRSPICLYHSCSPLLTEKERRMFSVMRIAGENLAWLLKTTADATKVKSLRLDLWLQEEV
jgi:hypothetical protein